MSSWNFANRYEASAAVRGLDDFDECVVHVFNDVCVGAGAGAVSSY